MERRILQPSERWSDVLYGGQDRDNDAAGTYLFCMRPRDITAQKADAATSFKKERALHHSEERLRLATEAGNIGIWDWDVLADKLS